MKHSKCGGERVGPRLRELTTRSQRGDTRNLVPTFLPSPVYEFCGQ